MPLWIGFVVVLLVACSSSDGTMVELPPCPTTSTAELPSCTAANEGQLCTIPPSSDSVSGRPNQCGCYGNWVCDDCPDGAHYGTGACVANDYCNWSGAEFDCSCACDPSGQWSCMAGEDNAPPGECGP